MTLLTYAFHIHIGFIIVSTVPMASATRCVLNVYTFVSSSWRWMSPAPITSMITALLRLDCYSAAPHELVPEK